MFYKKINSDLFLIDEQIKYLLVYAAYNPDVIVFEDIKAKIIGFTDFTDNNPVRVVTEDNQQIDVMLHQIRLVLRPITKDTENEITCDGVKEVDIFKGKVGVYMSSVGYTIKPTPIDVFIELISKHYDVFGLIDKGLAVDYNNAANG